MNFTLPNLTQLTADLPGNTIFHVVQALLKDNPVQILLAAPFFVFILFVLFKFVRNRLAKTFVQRTFSWFGLTCEHLKPFFMFALSIFIAAHFLMLSAEAATFLRLYIHVCIWVQLAIIMSSAAQHFVGLLLDKKAKENPTAESARPLSLLLTRIMIWSIGMLLVLDAFGFDITALLAGLGIGGMAMALAAKNILADLFASISIIADNPFRVGEKIQAGDTKGTVEYIGMKTTQVRAETGELIFCPNGILTNSKVKNLDRVKA